MGRRHLEHYLAELGASGAVTAAAAVVGDADAIAWQGGCGRKSRRTAGRVTSSSLFDLASLTKPVTATLALVLDQREELPLQGTVRRALAGDAGEAAQGLARKSLGSLLRHRSGFQAWAPLFADRENGNEIVSRLVSNASLHGAPRGTYSDLGYILWGLLAGRDRGVSVETLVRRKVAGPLGVEFSGRPGKRASVVECVLGNGRERELAAAQGIEIAVRRAPKPGTAQDGNARLLGPSGHAGLFSSARAMWRLAAEWARPSRLLSPVSVAAALCGRGDYALGWRRRPLETRGRDRLWYGHLGFTGGGVWFCPETTEIRVLLAHRSALSVDLSDWRRRFLEIRD